MYIGEALGQLDILERQRSLGLKDEFRTVRPFPWLVMEAYSDAFGHREVRVHVLHVAGDQEQAAKRQPEKECFCAPHFAMGVIESATPAIPDSSGLAAYKEALRTGQIVYDVWVCGGNEYVLYTGMKAHGWGRYYPGQMVIITIGSKMSTWGNPLDCNRKCLIDEPRFTNIAISGLHTDGMKRWTTWQ